MTCQRCKTRQKTKRHRWCRACQAAYHRDRNSRLSLMAERRGFLRGVRAIRTAAIALFEKIGDRELNGITAMELLEKMEV